MKKRILSIALALTLCLSLLPGMAWAADDHTRTETLVLTNEEDENSAQGWSWKRDTQNEGGYILTLDHVDFQVSSGNAIEFQLDKAVYLSPLTVQLKGENHVVSTEGVGFYADWNYRVLQPIVITGDSLEVSGKLYGIQFDNNSALEVRNATLTADATWTTTDASGDTGAYGLSVKGGSILLENSTLNVTRVRANSLTCRDSQLTATAKDGGYVRAIVKTNYLDFSGGKLTVYGPEGLNNRAVCSDCDEGGTPISLSDCELDIHHVEQGLEADTGDIKLDNVTGTILTTKSTPNNSIYQNAAFDGVGEGTCTNCHILAHTGTSVTHTYIYGDHTLTEDASWPSTGLHIQSGHTFTIAEGAKLTLTDSVTIHGRDMSGSGELVNNGTLEFVKNSPSIQAKLTNNGTLIVPGYLMCKPENFTNSGTFNGILDDTNQLVFGNAQIKYNRSLGKNNINWSWGYTIGVTDGAVLTILAGKTLDASQSARGITAETLQDYLAVAETGKIIVEPEGQLLLPAGVTQDQLDALRLSGGGTVKVGGENANWVTVMDGDKPLSAQLLIPNSVLDVTELEKDGFTLELRKGSQAGELFDPAEPITTDLTLCAKWLKVLDLPTIEPPVSAPEGAQYQLVMEEGLTQVPEGLQNVEDLNTVDAIQTALKTELTGVPEANKAVYDVKLMVKEGEDGEWEEATAANFPENGLTVTLPYPDRTNSSYTFQVVHMISVGNDAGTTETPDVTNAAKGIQFQVMSLSPISVGWTAPASSGSDDDGDYYAVTLEKPAHGALTADRKNASQGARVTLAVTPDRGYVLQFLTVTDAKGSKLDLTDQGSGKYTFQMPGGKVTVAAVFAPEEAEPAPCDGGAACPAHPFTDLDLSLWYHDGVHFCVEEGLMLGTSQTAFEPETPTTRAMLAAILWRLQGSPAMGGKGGTFPDVPENAWYTDAVEWAAAQGIVTGYGNGDFGPQDPITREQLAVMLYRYEEKYGQTAPDPQPENWGDFTDADEASSWGVEALKWGVETNIIRGKNAQKLAPQALSTRAETAAILQRCLQK